jgi:hypothetical protein
VRTISQVLLVHIQTCVVSVCFDGDKACVLSDDVEEDASRDMIYVNMRSHSG